MQWLSNENYKVFVLIGIGIVIFLLCVIVSLLNSIERTVNYVDMSG